MVEPEAVDYINSISADKIRDVINDLFMPILRIDNSGDNDDEAQFEVERKSNGFILKFKLDFDRNEASGEHLFQDAPGMELYFRGDSGGSDQGAPYQAEIQEWNGCHYVFLSQ